MAKKNINYSYSSAELTLNDNKNYILTETTKDDIKTFNLSTLLDSLIGYDNVSITVKTVNELESEEVDE